MSTAEPIEAPSVLLPAVVVGGGIVRQVAPTGDIVAAQEGYHTLCQALLNPTDYQQIGRRSFPKKSAWRKLAVAFNVSVVLLERVYERDPNGRIVRAEVVARATAPNGRTMDGFGACDLFEKCCPGTDGTPEDCTNRSQYHNHCRPNCNGKPHFSNPSHDLPSTAHTRATNRACADLFGMGEVSAEEITNAAAFDDHQEPDPYVALGWRDQDDHDSFRKAVDDRVKGLSPEAKAELKAWVDDPGNVPGGFRTTWHRSVAEAYRAEVNRLAGLGPRPDPTTGEVPANGAQAAQEGQAEAAADQPDQVDPPAAQEAGQGAQPDPEEQLLARIKAEVDALALGKVRAELKDSGQDSVGDPPVVRERLTMFRFNRQAWLEDGTGGAA